jgi:hypothetical protein
MLPGMMVEGFRQACHNVVRPLILVMDDDTDVTGARLFREYQHLCKDYKET